MHLSTKNDSRSLPASIERNTREAPGAAGATEPPPLTSGFGVVFEKEQDLRFLNTDNLGDVHGPECAALDRILRQHQRLLDANLALLERRCKALPAPARFAALRQSGSPPHGHKSSETPEAAALSELIARHTSLIGDLDALVARARDGQRGEPLLAEIEHNHEEMAWRLMRLLEEDEARRETARAHETPKTETPAP